MAAHGNNFIRVRLYFDYPPPAVVDCRMCWLLVDLNKCRVVADLESIIREKFEFSRRSILNLFIEDCYLPHTESIYVVRDNDSVRVKVDCLAQVNGNSSCPDTGSEKRRKRQRPAEEDGPGGNEVSTEWKKEKRKKVSEESLARDAKQPSGDERTKKSTEKHTEKKKRKKKEKNVPVVAPKPAASTKNTPVRVEQPVTSNKKPPKTQTVSSSDSSSSSSSEEDQAPKKTAPRKPAPKTPSSTPAAPKAPPTTKPTQTKPRPPSSSSSDSSSSSSSDEATSVKTPSTNKPSTSTTPKTISDESKSQQASDCAPQQAASIMGTPQDQKPCTSSSEEEIELVIKRPMQQLGRGAGNQSSWRGRGRGTNWRGGPAERGRGGGRGGSRGHNGSFRFNYDDAKEPHHQTDSLTNVSVVIQNRAERAPKKDYSSMPLLAAPPQVGQTIAFKLLELTENYTPEVSDYKEGKIVSFDLTTRQIELELHNAFQAPVEPGKFDLVYQNPDGSERVEYAVSRGSRVTERWDSLLEPRLII